MELTINLFEQLIIVLVLSLIKTTVTVMNFVRKSIIDNIEKKETVIKNGNSIVYKENYTKIKNKYKTSNLAAIWTGIGLIFLFAYVIYYLLFENFDISVELEALEYFIPTMIILIFVIYITLFLSLGQSLENFTSVIKYLYNMKVGRITFRRCTYKYIKDNKEGWFYRFRLRLYSFFLVQIVKRKSRKQYIVDKIYLLEHDRIRLDLTMENYPFVIFRKTNEDIIYNILVKSTTMFYIISLITSQVVFICVSVYTNQINTSHFDLACLAVMILQLTVFALIVFRLYIIILSDKACDIDNEVYEKLVELIEEERDKIYHNEK